MFFTAASRSGFYPEQASAWMRVLEPQMLFALSTGRKKAFASPEKYRTYFSGVWMSFHDA